MSCLLRTYHPAPRLIPAISLASLGLLTSLCLSVPAHAAINETVPTADGLAQLEQRARDANPREQCFLYTELVHTMTEMAGKEISDGETEQAATTLQKVNQYAHLIQLNLARNTKKIKDAQMLMHHTTYRLAQYLHLVSPDDQKSVQDTLKQLNEVNEELLAQVFQH